MLSLMICASLVIHGLIFFVFSVFSMQVSPVLKQKQSAEPFSLVNLVLVEPTLPEAPPPAPEIPPAPLIEESIEESVVEFSANSPAENFIPLEDKPILTAFITPQPSYAAAAPTFQSAGSPSGEISAQIAAYVDRNYSYIQRRIRDKLVYPSQARRAGIQGTAELAFTIHEDGRVSGVTVIVSSGSELLDSAAEATIYAAAPFRQPPAPARLVIPVAFRLH